MALLQQRVELPAHGTHLSLAQRLEEGGIGGVVWDCGAAMARVIDRCPALVQGRQVAKGREAMVE